jgi:hypothetical protein
MEDLDEDLVLELTPKKWNLNKRSMEPNKGINFLAMNNAKSISNYFW